MKSLVKKMLGGLAALILVSNISMNMGSNNVGLDGRRKIVAAPFYVRVGDVTGGISFSLYHDIYGRVNYSALCAIRNDVGGNVEKSLALCAIRNDVGGNVEKSLALGAIGVNGVGGNVEDSALGAIGVNGVGGNVEDSALGAIGVNDVEGNVEKSLALGLLYFSKNGLGIIIGK